MPRRGYFHIEVGRGSSIWQTGCLNWPGNCFQCPSKQCQTPIVTHRPCNSNDSGGNGDRELEAMSATREHTHTRCLPHSTRPLQATGSPGFHFTVPPGVGAFLLWAPFLVSKRSWARCVSFCFWKFNHSRHRHEF